MDNKIITYLDENSTQVQPKTALIIAENIGIAREKCFERCIFLSQKGTIKEIGFGGSIENRLFYT